MWVQFAENISDRIWVTFSSCSRKYNESDLYTTQFLRLYLSSIHSIHLARKWGKCLQARLRPQSGLPDISFLCCLYLDLLFLSAIFLWTSTEMVNVIGVVTRIRAGRFGVRIPAGVKYRDWFWGHPAPYSVGFWGSIPESNAVRAWCWPILPRLKIIGAYFCFYFACLLIAAKMKSEKHFCTAAILLSYKIL